MKKKETLGLLRGTSLILLHCFYFLAGALVPSTYFLEIKITVPDPQLVKNFNESTAVVFNNTFEITDFEVTTGTNCPLSFHYTSQTCLEVR